MGSLRQNFKTIYTDLNIYIFNIYIQAFMFLIYLFTHLFFHIRIYAYIFYEIALLSIKQTTLNIKS